MLYKETPIGLVEVPKFIESELRALTDEELIKRAVKEHNNFVMSPEIFTIIELRGLKQKVINKIEQ
mgnify:CR=1 FL=1